jgi:tungstate transport system substrate-binding protein
MTRPSCCVRVTIMVSNRSSSGVPHVGRGGIRIAVLLVATIAGTVAGCRDAPVSPRYAILATTTSVQSSGLLDVLLPAFRRDNGYDLRVFLAGSGRALEMLRHRDADVVISHAPEAEARMLAAQPRWVYRKLMFNAFVLVGPADDPAGVRTATSVTDAMRGIARSTARFVSRGDESGTHERERALWHMAGAAPAAKQLLVSGAGMSTTLRQASEAAAYTLTDEPTFLRLSNSIDLVVLFEDESELLNTYAVVVGDPASPGHDIALEWMNWLLQGRGGALIAAYRVGGQVAFHRWPEDARSADPHALPASRIRRRD